MPTYYLLYGCPDVSHRMQFKGPGRSHREEGSDKPIPTCQVKGCGKEMVVVDKVITSTQAWDWEIYGVNNSSVMTCVYNERFPNRYRVF